MAEITGPDYPGERLIAWEIPFLEAERARKRESLLAATETDLEKITTACARVWQPLRGVRLGQRGIYRLEAHPSAITRARCKALTKVFARGEDHRIPVIFPRLAEFRI